MRMGPGHRMSVAPPDVEVPVRRRFVSVLMGMAVDASHSDSPERDRTKRNQ